MGHGTDVSITLIKLIVDEDIFLVLFIVDHTLMDVFGTRIAGDGDDVGDVALFVRYIVDGKGVLVVAVADVTTLVSLIGAPVDQALGVMDVTITRRTTWARGVRRICHVDEDETTTARQLVSNPDGLVATDGAASNGVIELLVDDDVVSSTHWKVVPVSCEIVLSEVGGALRVEIEQLFHVKDLNTMIDSLGADDGIISKNSNFSPVGSNGIILRQSAEIDQLALGANFCKGRAVILTNGNELSSGF